MINKFIFFFFSFLVLPNANSNVIRFNKLSDDINNASVQVIRNLIIDKSGILWIATGYSGFYKYDGYKLLPINLNDTGIPLTINQISIDRNGHIWIGTEQYGLLKYNTINNSITEFTFENSSIKSNNVSFIMPDSEKGLWIGTNKGLALKTPQGNFENYPIDSNASQHYFVKSILMSIKNNLIISTDKGLYMLKKDLKALNKINDYIVNVMFQDKRGQIWFGTNDGLYFSKSITDPLEKVEGISQRVSAITQGEKYIWVGTYYGGVFKISDNGLLVNNFRYDPSNKDSLSDNVVLSLFYNNSGVLWISTFNNGISYFDTKTEKFGLEFDSNSSVYCAINNVNFNFYEDELKNLWISTENGLVKFNRENNTCQLYLSDSDNSKTLSSSFIFHVLPFKNNQLWVSTDKGFNLFDIKTGHVERINNGLPKTNVFFSANKNEKNLLIGSRKGLFNYSIVEKNFKQIVPVNGNNDVRYYTYVKDIASNYLFATDKGIYKLDTKDKLEIYSEIQDKLPNVEILSLHFDKKNKLWVGTDQRGLFRFDQHNNLDIHFTKKHGISEYSTIYSILEDNQNNIWMGTTKGLIRLNVNSNATHIFQKKDGLQGDFFNKASAYKAEDGKFYFGGRTGFNSFYPENIKLNIIPPKIILTDFTRFGQSVKVGVKENDFLLEKDINALEHLTLTHKDYVIGFEFAALDYADPSRNKYAYKMDGLDPNWIYVDADNRKISYSNLKSGEYTFRVKGSNKDGIWNEIGKSLKITVKPAPWLSWWAYLIYIAFFIYIMMWYLKRKNRVNLQITNMLKNEVEKQTKELQIQKQTVETLLAKKNELFANVSHEFRTPLTLILGPVNKLLNAQLPHSDIKALKMVNRNANRLLTMIEQLLQIAQVSDFDKIKFYHIKTHEKVKEIVDAFIDTAHQKRITLTITKNENAIIKTSKDALEIILSNLLSNAIKYTPIGGNIEVEALNKNNAFHLHVKDSGCGLDEVQQKEIFNRFKRLDYHQNIQGIGIGLSVVEELIKVNGASITINSQLGAGSIFKVVFKCSDKEVDTIESNKSNLLIKQLCNDLDQSQGNETNSNQKFKSKYKETILIIEDNHDMRNHINDCLKDYYNCLLADRGKKGIALAIEHIPDIIICDVMMPEMDGFHVSRVVRSDTRTSHIPLMLLTALNDKESRIRGWREHVDVYLTKPFDVDELLLRIENILVIRNILKDKNAKKIKAGKKTPSNIDLPKRDQEFVEKLNKIIVKNYQNPMYLRPKMASDMAVSERQLQRKLKALIGKNPMDLLREYRLSQATIMLKDGYQVSITADECGFNSVTYFSQCFKAQYGLSPKVYQQTCKSK